MPILLTLATLTALSMGLLLFTEAGRDLLAEHGQGMISQALRERELALKQQLVRSFGWSATEEELDLANPSEKDLRFLLETFAQGDAAARLSAARALVVLQEPRAVLPFLVTPGTGEERAFFCGAALEILRFRDRVTTVTLLAQALEQETDQLEPSCREELKAKLAWLQPFDVDVLQALLTHSVPGLQLFGLKHIMAEPPEELLQTIAELTQSRELAVGKAASAWMSAQGLEVVPEPPAVAAPAMPFEATSRPSVSPPPSSSAVTGSPP